MRKITALLLLCFAFACVRKQEQTPEELKAQLAKTMTDFLYKGVNYDSAHVKYNITEVVYYTNLTDYVCEFKVHVHDEHKDTTGMMSARITKDMKTVFRRF